MANIELVGTDMLLGVGMLTVNGINPLRADRIDRSQPVLLTSIQDLIQYTAAVVDFEVVLDLDDDESKLRRQASNNIPGNVDRDVWSPRHAGDHSRFMPGYLEIATEDAPRRPTPRPWWHPYDSPEPTNDILRHLDHVHVDVLRGGEA